MIAVDGKSSLVPFITSWLKLGNGLKGFHFKLMTFDQFKHLYSIQTLSLERISGHFKRTTVNHFHNIEIFDFFMFYCFYKIWGLVSISETKSCVYMPEILIYLEV